MATTTILSSPQPIPVLLLKTRSQPDDTYEEHFSQPPATPAQYTFVPHFIPVLEHTQNATTLSHLADLLRTGELKRKYGGMIFTSQRAVEAWADVVSGVEGEPVLPTHPKKNEPPDPFANIEQLTPFPLYVVGPATERALTTLIAQSQAQSSSTSSKTPFTRLNPTIHGAHTGNGASLAQFILSHYNTLHAHHHFTYFEAPRLPFIPLLGMSSENYGRKRLEAGDERLRKKGMLFLVGEVRRDVIPRTLVGEDLGVEERIGVEEVEVYRTEVMGGFEREFGEVCESVQGGLRAVVVFSPQGSDGMLRRIGYLDEEGRVTERARKRWWEGGDEAERGGRWIVVTIGPTTRDYLRDKLGVEPDVCAEKPSPEGLRQGIERFLEDKKVVV